MSNNLSNIQFNSTPIYRGIIGSNVQSPLGMHWSEEHGLNLKKYEQRGAARFVSSGDEYEGALNLRPGEKGTIIHGKPQKGSTTFKGKKDKEFLKDQGVIGAMGPEDDLYDPERIEKESEIPVRPGSKMLVVGLTRVRKSKTGTKKRFIKYQPARVMDV